MSQINTHPDPIKEYYIAYFDLLGYKDFFKSHPNKAEEFLSAIHDSIFNTKKYIQEINASLLGGKFGKLDINVKIFSDNVLLCLETGSEKIEMIEYPRFLAFLSIVADIQRNFILNYGLFLRGGITIGSLSFNEDFIFGQGLIDAVELEETAVYPRIVVSEAALSFIRQLHFVKQSDLDRACDIEKRAHLGENIKDEELSFCNSIMPVVEMEKLYLKVRDILLLHVFDRAVSLNYLYCVEISDALDTSMVKQLLAILEKMFPNEYRKLTGSNQDPLRLLERHKSRIIQKIKEFGQYNDIDISAPNAVKTAELREKILKKYLWVMMVHNYICQRRCNTLKYMIKSGSTCDIHFMRMTVEIIEDEISDEDATEKL